MSHLYPFPLSIWFVNDINSFLILFLSYFVNHIPFVAHCQTLPWNHDRWCPLLHTYLAMPQCTQRIQTHLSGRSLPAGMQQSLRRSWWYLLQAWRASFLLQICLVWVAAMYNFIGLHFSDTEKINQESYLEGQNSLNRNKNKPPGAKFCFSYSQQGQITIPVTQTLYPEDLRVNISPALVATCFPESMQDLQPVNVSNLVWKCRSLGAWGPCIALGWTSAFQEILMPRSPMSHQQRNG